MWFVSFDNIEIVQMEELLVEKVMRDQFKGLEFIASDSNFFGTLRAFLKCLQYWKFQWFFCRWQCIAHAVHFHYGT